jgi:hypothetical protein
MAKVSAKYCDVLVGKYLISTRAQAFDLDTGNDDLDSTCFQEGSHNSILGLGLGKVRFAGVFDASASGDVQVHKLGSAVTNESNQVITVMVGQGASPAVGDPGYSLSARRINYGVDASVADILKFTSEARNVGYRGDWGKILTAGVASVTGTASHTGSSVNHGAQTTNGGVGYLHVHTEVTSGDTFSIVIQDSADDTTYASLISFSADGTSATSERAIVTGTTDQYTRVLATRTGTAGGTLKFGVNFSRYLLNQEVPQS